MRIADRELLQDHGERHLRLDHRELPPDARALAIAERLVGVRVPRGFRLRQPAVDVELLRIGPHAGIAVQAGCEDVDRAILAQMPFTADHLILERGQREGRRGRPQPQPFLQDALDHVQFCDIRIIRPPVAGQHAVHLGIGLRQHMGVPEQQMLREGQQAAGRLMPGDQEGQHLIADVDIVQPLARFRVDRRNHQVEQVLAVVRMRAAF